MGTSNWQNISYNIELIRKIDPKTILDVGVGFGRWGILAREFLEIWDSAHYDGNWERKITGIEIFPGYIKDYHKYFYDEIIIDDALNFFGNSENIFDLVIFGDVIEHFSKNEGIKLIEKAVQRSRYVMINVPIGRYWAQDGTAENPFEAHKSVWYNNDFTKFLHHKIRTFYDIENREFSVVLISNSRFKFTKKYGRYFKIKNFLKHRLGLKRPVEWIEKKRSGQNK